MRTQTLLREPLVPYRTVLVDDERLARLALRALLSEYPDLAIVGEASSGTEAAAAIRSLAPHVVFMDIEMPEKDGLRVLEELAPHERPAVVFVTAHRRYAVEAFNISAVDYVLKPISHRRFGHAVRRVLQFLRGEHAGEATGIMPPFTRTNRLAVRDRNRLTFVDVSDIRWFEVYGNYLRVAVGDRRLLIHSTLCAMAAQLDAALFVRISRSSLVNVRHVRSLRPIGHGQYELEFVGRDALRSSRRYGRQVRAAFGA